MLLYILLFVKRFALKNRKLTPPAEFDSLSVLFSA